MVYARDLDNVIDARGGILDGGMTDSRMREIGFGILLGRKLVEVCTNEIWLKGIFVRDVPHQRLSILFAEKGRTEIHPHDSTVFS